MITSDSIKKRLWDGANELRGSMDASRYKDYMLGLMFYKFLSDKTLETFKISARLGQVAEEELVQTYKKARLDYGESLDKSIQQVLGYFVKPEYLYQVWVEDINSGNFELQKVTDSLNEFERSIYLEEGAGDFKGLFASSTIDMTDTALGSNLNERSKNIQELIILFADLNMVKLQKSDILGDAYEFLIGQFAMESGKKAGEFYTPHQVSEVMAQIVTKSSNISQIYDPTVGSGSLLLTVGKHLGTQAQKDLHYYGQEMNTATYNLARMNLLLHGVRPEKITMRNDNTLAHDWPEDPEKPGEGVLFDAIVMNPPYSAKKWNKAGLKISDPRFEIAGVLPPDSKGDYAFLLHGLFHLSQDGTMAIVLPHGVLFRGGSEGEIRKRLIDKNHIDAVLGLPSNLFTNTGIPVTILILKKDRALDEPILIIDASNEFKKVGKQNILQEKHIARLVDTYVERKAKEGYSALISREDILENDYNLNIPRYVSPLSDDIAHDVDAHLLGGIPVKNIEDLPVLNSLVGDILWAGLEETRPGYFELTQDIEELKTEVFESAKLKGLSENLSQATRGYLAQYFELISGLEAGSDSRQLMEKMLLDIKGILADYSFVDAYNGYQLVAEIWGNSLNEDTEVIALTGFYEAARSMEANMVSKGSGDKKRMVQEGWISSLIPNELIVRQIFSLESLKIEELKQKLAETEAELDDLLEAAKVEESEENEILYDCITKNKEGEAGNSFVAKAVKDQLKNYDKNSDEYPLLKKTEKLLAEKSALGSKIRKKAAELEEAVAERIPKLNKQEVEALAFEKWFGSLEEDMLKLIRQPLEEELDKLKLLKTRYSSTLKDLEEEGKKVEKSFESLLAELVVS